MKILHGTWIPQAEDGFVQRGVFYIWVETTEIAKQPKTAQKIHPSQLFKKDLESFLAQELGIKSELRQYPIAEQISPQYFLLPSQGDSDASPQESASRVPTASRPLPSLELSRYLEQEVPETFDLQYWQVDCFAVKVPVKTSGFQYELVNNVIKLLNELHFIAINNLAEVQLGADLLFWYHYTQAFKQIILRDQYIPALKYREIAAAKTTAAAKGKGKATKSATKATTQGTPDYEISPGWEIVSERYEADLKRYVDYMPLACVAGFAKPRETPEFYDREGLLRHFSECLLAEIVTHTPSTAGFDQKIANTLLSECITSDGSSFGKNAALKLYQQWRTWRDRIRHTQTAIPFYLCFQLCEPGKPEEDWELQFLMAPRQDPSQRVPLAEYWSSKPKRQKELQKQLGDSFEQNLLLNLGYAARIYPKLWQGLETDRPVSIFMDLAGAFEFLQDSAWVLESAGYKVIIPAWWTPKGHQRAKVRLRAKGKSLSSAKEKAKSYFSYDNLVEYQYDLAIGGEQVTEKEWMELVKAKSPLVKFRGQWMHLDQDKMQQMLEFWKKQQQENPELTLIDFMRMTAEGGEDLEVEFDRAQSLAEMLDKLHDKSRLEAIADPVQLQGTLREYQKRGVSWLSYLEQLGLNGCLADDMGLGKTVQVIARLVQEQEQATAPLKPTLLIAPTSVVGNWRKEIEKFAPHLKAIVHHGTERAKDVAEFQAMANQNQIVITSFTLIRKDLKLIESVDWHRLVLDEAQNIKNPKAEQTKAILKLSAPHRLALTGTPVENRLLDLWSIFNFLNPGYLGKEAQFRKSFEVPIQKNNDRVQSATLKKLVEPFILRRVKTDQSIIKDLPDKVEQKLYCNLTKEQASLYEAVVKDVTSGIDEAEGIQRKGLILATLLKLKQICNHPRQFLQDESDFTPARSHKLSRLSEMVAEVMEEGESLLIFTQFTELGDALEKYLRHTCRYNTYYLHGGTNRNKREAMITEFQDPETEPSVFILSLKAGGVGITLTKANHVFHFDRWWNPAVENQATDRAFRIGQKKNVFVHKFVAIGTLEERIDEMIEDKKKLAGSIVGSDESWLTELDNDAFKKLISLNKSAILE